MRFLEQRGRRGNDVVLLCLHQQAIRSRSKYVCLYEITRLKQKFGGRVKAIGFSGHHLGIAADLAALALGAEWFERHFTLDRTWRGTDHAASLEPDGLRRLSRDLRGVSRALRFKPREILDVEKPQRERLKWEPARDG